MNRIRAASINTISSAGNVRSEVLAVTSGSAVLELALRDDGWLLVKDAREGDYLVPPSKIERIWLAQ